MGARLNTNEAPFNESGLACMLTSVSHHNESDSMVVIPLLSRLKVSIETFPDTEVPGETARGRALSVAATQALSGP